MMEAEIGVMHQGKTQKLGRGKEGFLPSLSRAFGESMALLTP